MLEDIVFPKKRKRKITLEVKQRIIIVGTTSWKNEKKIRDVIKGLDPETIDFIVTDTSRGCAQLTVKVCKALGIPLIQTHPWHHIPNSRWIWQNAAMKLFKPTLVIGFNEDVEYNASTESYSRLCGRAGVTFKLIEK